MSFVSKAVIFSLIVAGLAYWWATNFNIPDGLEQKSEVAWIYGAAKIGMFLAELGEKIGLGHRAILLRKLASVQFLESKKSIHADIRKYKDSFAGVEVLVIEPTEKDPYGPALIWIHGGGWVLGSAEMDTEFLEELSKAMKMVIVSIEYRMAPEFPYPTPLDDCFAATKHFIENALDHNVDPFRIAVGGMSAGGNLAAALSMKIRDSNLTWKFKLQILGVPCLQAYRFDTPSYNQNYLDEILSRPSMTNYWLWYAFGSEGHLLLDDFLEGRHQKVIDPNGKLAPFVDWKSFGIKSPSTTTSDPASSSAAALSKESEKEIEKLKGVLVDPLYAPLLARNLSGLPATYLITAEFDVLRDEGMMYGERLKRQGVETKMMHYQGAFHDILLWTEHYNVSKRILRDIVDYLKVKL